MHGDIAVALERLPRIRLATLPTPLHELHRLRDALGGARRAPRILVKRDDLTGLAGGGNKARKLEFLVADALREGATVLVTTGGVQSNHARMTAAAGRTVGLGTSLVLTAGSDAPEVQGNLLLDHLFGAEVGIGVDHRIDPRWNRFLVELVLAARHPFDAHDERWTPTAMLRIGIATTMGYSTPVLR